MALFFACALSTCRAVQRVSNPECRTTAGTSGECATYPGREGKLRFIYRRAAFAAGREVQSKGLCRSLPAVAARKARQTTRLCEIVGLVGYALGGLPGERLLNRLGIKSSDDTVLRRVKTRRRGSSQPTVRVLSVDDWAWRKRQRYGTMLMDLERPR
jgi:hypothetical protein